MQETREPKGQDRGQAIQQRKQAERDSGPIIIVTEDDDEIIDPAKETAYLTAAGWKKVAPRDTPNPKKRWLDPESGKPARKVLVVPEVRDLAGRLEKEAVYQHLAGSSPWFYNRQEAVRVQRDRDEAKKKGPA